MNLEAWQARGEWIPLPDGDVFAMRLGADSGEDPALILHGFPTSSWDFWRCAEAIATSRPVVLFDFIGFGLSAKPPEFGYTLFEQADVAVAVLKHFGVQRAHLWAHDMGTSVACELLARRERGALPFDVSSLALMNGSVYVEMAQLTVGQRLLLSPLGSAFARLNSRRTFAQQMRAVFAGPVADDELDTMWALLCRDDGLRVLPQIIDYIRQRGRHRARWNGALARFDAPTLVAWGARDPVAILAIAERLARTIPQATMELWPELGHYPQVQDAARVAATLTTFWASVEKSAALEHRSV